jgi:hypothetical protein
MAGRFDRRGANLTALRVTFQPIRATTSRPHRTRAGIDDILTLLLRLDHCARR